MAMGVPNVRPHQIVYHLRVEPKVISKAYQVAYALDALAIAA